ncbi:ATP-binding protein [Sphingomonas sp. LHG3406-1]|uniref:ATP-binding protein n=1 Tax=Sphingomonas sp. LHG3406-1 TaxID=2804617 RepID=UPI0026079C3C|nr:ATP-binding protein [Sphingomonas sp. LHG3406-1]
MTKTSTHSVRLLPRQLVASILGVLCVVMIAQLANLQWRNVSFEQRLLSDVETSNERSRLAFRYLSQLQDVETSQRGFVVTGRPDFLQPLEAARREIPRIARQLERSYPAGSQEAAIVADLVRSGQDKILYSEGVIALRLRGGQASASAVIASGHGKRLMDHARVLAATLEHHEKTLTRNMLVRAADQRASRQTTVLVTEVVLLAVALVLMGLLVSTVRTLHHSTRRLTDSGMRQSAIFDNATDAMMMLDEKGDIISVNAAAERLFGRSSDAMIGCSNLTLFAEPPLPEVSQAYLQGLARNEAWARPSQDFVGRRGDGTYFETEVVTTPVQLHECVQFLAVGRDITERRRVERMKTDFVATVSHELRTPLTSISGSLGLLAGGAAGELGAKARRLIEIALNNSQRLIRLINDILDIEKIESGKMEFDNQELPLESLLQQVVDANSGYAEKHQVSMEVGAVPADAAIMADADRMSQVLTNLLSNAIKFSPVGGVVTLSVERFGKHWRISVIDRGPGISEEFRSRIFGKFAQADGSDSRLVGGSGLGLSIVKEIVLRSGGEVSFTSVAGEGSTFHVDLPAVATFPPADDTQITARTMPDQGYRILHVEDDADMLRLVASALEGRAEVHSTPSVHEARASLRRHHYDAVLLDIAMQDGCGLDLVSLIRQIDPATPIVLFTALDVSAGVASTVDRVLTKSLTSLTDLSEQVGALLERDKRKAA